MMNNLCKFRVIVCASNKLFVLVMTTDFDNLCYMYNTYIYFQSFLKKTIKAHLW